MSNLYSASFFVEVFVILTIIGLHFPKFSNSASKPDISPTSVLLIVNFSNELALNPVSVSTFFCPFPFFPITVKKTGDSTASCGLSPVVILISYTISPSAWISKKHFFGSVFEQGDRGLIQWKLNFFGPLKIWIFLHLYGWVPSKIS